MQHERQERWHIGKEIPVVLVFTIIGSIVSGIVYAGRLETRLATLETNMQVQDNLRDDVLTIKEQLRSLDRQLERLIRLQDRAESDKTDMVRPKLQLQ